MVSWYHIFITHPTTFFSRFYNLIIINIYIFIIIKKKTEFSGCVCLKYDTMIP